LYDGGMKIITGYRVPSSTTDLLTHPVSMFVGTGSQPPGVVQPLVMAPPPSDPHDQATMETKTTAAATTMAGFMACS
jgi:hypothetical protein